MPSLANSSRKSRRLDKPMHRFEKWLSAIVVTLALPFFTPTSFVFGTQSLHYDSPSGRMVQEREAMFPAVADWRANFYVLEDARWTLLCYGGADGSSYPAGTSAKAMAIDVWVGEDGCEAKLVEGKTYRASASWTEEFFIWRWTAQATSQPFTWP